MAPEGYLLGVLADGARPFPFRGGVSELLGQPPETGVRVRFAPGAPRGGFAYVRPAGDGAGQATGREVEWWDFVASEVVDEVVDEIALAEPAGERPVVDAASPSGARATVVIPGITSPAPPKPDTSKGGTAAPPPAGPEASTVVPSSTRAPRPIPESDLRQDGSAARPTPAFPHRSALETATVAGDTSATVLDELGSAASASSLSQGRSGGPDDVGTPAAVWSLPHRLAVPDEPVSGAAHRRAASSATAQNEQRPEDAAVGLPYRRAALDGPGAEAAVSTVPHRHDTLPSPAAAVGLPHRHATLPATAPDEPRAGLSASSLPHRRATPSATTPATAPMTASDEPWPVAPASSFPHRRATPARPATSPPPTAPSRPIGPSAAPPPDHIVAAAPPPAPPPIVVVAPSAPPPGTPLYWERRHLARLRTRILR